MWPRGCTPTWRSKFPFRRPERLEFARGVCQLGRAMPGHAREVLAALNAAGLGEAEKNLSDPAAVAALTKTGAGTLTLGGMNTYAGGTTISAGTEFISGTGADHDLYDVASRVG